MKIAIGLPTNRGFKPQMIFSLLQLIEKSKEHTFTFLVETEGLTIEDSRNKIVENAKGNDYLLFIDDDMVFPPEILGKLLSRRKEIIACKALSRRDQSLNFSSEGIRGRPLSRGIHRVEYAGTGIMLIDIKVFDGMQKPYFQIRRDNRGKIMMGEDVDFCYKNKGKVFVDTTIEVKHIGDYLY